MREKLEIRLKSLELTIANKSSAVQQASADLYKAQGHYDEAQHALEMWKEHEMELLKNNPAVTCEVT